MRHITKRCGSPIRGTGSGVNTAFTLIELLIVVAIIAILAAIAVPNFLEAQTRSKVSRVKADMRSLRTALEAYRVDNNHYLPDLGDIGYELTTWARLTSPVAYITSVPSDAFRPKLGQGMSPTGPSYFAYGADIRWASSTNLTHGWPPEMRAVGLEYWMLSPGPDQDYDLVNYPAWGDGSPWVRLDAGTGTLEVLYEATNGTRSSGDIIASNKRAYN